MPGSQCNPAELEIDAAIETSQIKNDMIVRKASMI